MADHDCVECDEPCDCGFEEDCDTCSDCQASADDNDPGYDYDEH